MRFIRHDDGYFYLDDGFTSHLGVRRFAGYVMLLNTIVPVIDTNLGKCVIFKNNGTLCCRIFAGLPTVHGITGTPLVPTISQMPNIRQ